MSSKESARPMKTSTVQQTVVAGLEAPRLQGVGTKHFTNFLKQRQLYEKQVKEKNEQPGYAIPLTSYKASIDDSFLRIFLTFQWIDAQGIEQITEDQLQRCVRDRASFKPESNDLLRVQRISRKLHMDMSIKEAEERVLALSHRYWTVLEAAGMQDLPKSKPHIAIRHILKCIKPRSLQKRMKYIVEWRKNEESSKDFGSFMRELIKQASKYDALQGAQQSDSCESDSSLSSSDEKNVRKSSGKKTKNRQSGGRKRTRDRTTNHRDEKGSERGKKSLPPCLLPECDGFHFISDCPKATEEQKKKLRKEYREKKKARSEAPNGQSSRKGSVYRIGAEKIDSHSSLFSAYFGKGAVEVVVLGDQGADANIIPASIYRLLKESDTPCKPKLLEPPHAYDTIAPQAGVDNTTPRQLVCKEQVTLDVSLRIRHGCTLILRGIVWEIAEANMDYVIIGHKVLAAIGCDNKAILAAACDKNAGVINVPEALDSAQKEMGLHAGQIASLLAGSTYHSAAAEGDDGLDEEKVYIDLGEDEDADVDKALQVLVSKARQNGMSQEGAAELSKLIEEFKPVFG